MTTKFRFSTASAPAGERFDFWREIAWAEQGLIELAIDGPASAFHGEVEIDVKGPSRRLRRTGAPTLSRRSERGIADRPCGGYVISRERGDGSLYSHGRPSIALAHNDILITDFDAPGELRPRARFDSEALFLPKPFVDRHLVAGARLVARRLSGEPGVEALTTTFVHALFDEWEALSPAALGAAVDTLGRLIGLVCGAAAQDHAEALTHGRLVEVERYIEAHLADPGLSPAKAAAALKMSERALYQLFEASGSTFAGHARRRRLEECRAALIAHPRRAVTDIALAWGFGSLPSFYRAFQAAFGMTASEWRNHNACVSPPKSAASETRLRRE